MGEEMKQPGRAGKNRKSRVVLILLLLLAVMAAVIIWVLLQNRNTDEAYGRYVFDEAAVEGRIRNLSNEEVQQELNRIVEEGMFNISIASSILYDQAADAGQARIENIAANRYHMQVVITLDDTGEVIYSSGLIAPGFSIEHITFSRPLEIGEYAATATFHAITEDEHLHYGATAAQITIYVVDENGNYK